MSCPNCNSENCVTKLQTEWIPYGGEPYAFQATFPVMTCSDCSFGWTDWRKENAVEAGVEAYLSDTAVRDKSVDEFSEKVRELLAEHIGDSAGVREAYREALLLLAAEL